MDKLDELLDADCERLGLTPSAKEDLEHVQMQIGAILTGRLKPANPAHQAPEPHVVTMALNSTRAALDKAYRDMLRRCG